MTNALGGTTVRGTDPWHPSVKATAKVTAPLPAPTVCPHCAGQVALVRNKKIYGKDYGQWPWSFLCLGCGAYVGLHPYTAIPLGTLATPEMREARARAKQAFNPLWKLGVMSRTDAYAWLAGKLGIEVEKCHIGWFDVVQCDAVVEAVKGRL